MKVFTLTFEFQSYWHIGEGSEAGSYADALMKKDDVGLPFVPGKSVKGVLRQAFSTASENLWFGEYSATLVNRLFGEQGNKGIEAQGLLQISSARLLPQERAFFNNKKEDRKLLFTVLQSTAIDAHTGVAKEGSLRSIEVAVPVTLQAKLTVNPNHPDFSGLAEILESQFAHWLDLSLSLISELGAKRHRGLGKVVITAEANDGGR